MTEPLSDTQLAALLADASVWAEPGAGLEDAVVHAVTIGTDPVPISSARRRKRRFGSPRVVVGSAAAAVAIAATVALTTVGGTAPDFTGRLVATALAPTASGSVKIVENKGGYRISLHAAGLADLPHGQYYQAWLKNGAGDLVPIGTFSSSRSPVTLWSGVDPTQFSTMSVTVERTDNVQESSGRRVLAGALQPR